jgi:hypothetical protein
MIHVVLILLGKILVDVIPGIEQDTSWTIVNMGYIAVSIHLLLRLLTSTLIHSLFPSADIIPHVPLRHRHTLRKQCGSLR